MLVVLAIVRVEEAELPMVRVTLVGLSERLGAPLDGDMVAVRLTEPAKSPRLSAVIIDDPEKPCMTVTLVGSAVSEKSDFALSKVPVWTVSGTGLPVLGLTSVTHVFGTLVLEQPAKYPIVIPAACVVPTML